MSVFHIASGPRRAALTVAGICFISGMCLISPHAQAAPPRYNDILPLSRVKPGMVGYGLTTFKGTTISRFNVTVIGILRRANIGHDLILIRMSGGPITERHANLIHGMSGSPIYLDGKVAGAFSMAEQFPREPIGMVTPIEDMLEAWDPNIPQEPGFYRPANKNLSSPSHIPPAADTLQPDRKSGTGIDALKPSARTIDLPQPIRVGDREITRLVLNAPPNDPEHSTENTAVLHPTTQMLSVSGLSEKSCGWLQKELDRRGYALTVMAAPGSSAGRSGSGSGFKGAPLKPGSAFGAWLATGDVEVGGTGTVTYRRGNRILCFGHPLLGLGALNAAISSAYILDIFPGYDTSHHIAEPGPIIGTLRQDRNFSVSGEIGYMPKLIPFVVHIHDHTTGRSKTFHVRMFQHPDLTPVLMRLAARDLIEQMHNFPGDVMANVTTTINADEVGDVTRSNLVFSSADIATAATADLDSISEVVSGNPFYALPIRGGEMTVDIRSGHDTATIERIFLPQGKYAPGDTVQIGVELKPYRREPILRTLSLKIPSDTPSGRYPLTVRGGMATMTRMGPFVISSSAPDTHVPPTNVRQMVSRLYERDRNTDMAAHLTLNTAAPTLEGEKLSQLPPNLAVLMRTDRDSGVKLERDELHTVTSTPYVVSGVQQLVITLQRKDDQEPTGRNGLEGSSSGYRSGGLSSLQAGRSIGQDNSESQEDVPAEPVPDDPGAGDAAPNLASGSDLGRWMSAAPPASPGKSTKKGTTTQSAPPASEPAHQTETPDSNDTKTDSTRPGDDKPITRPLQIWRQTARNDFTNGKFTGTSVTASGELRIAPSLHRLTTSDATYVWSLAADSQGNLYAGTGTDGKILKIDPQGRTVVFSTLPELSVQSLLLANDGTLWAGSGVQGNIYHIRPSGEAVRVCSLPEKYIMAMAQDSRGSLYIAPGSGNTVYRLKADQDAFQPLKPESWLKTSEDHIIALTLDSKDNLYVGTGNEGILYKVDPNGKSRVLYDAKENSITALAADSQGNVYAGTGPRGVLYRIAPDGSATVLFDHATAFYTGLSIAQDGRIYASTVNAVYRILPARTAQGDPVVEPLDNPKDVDFLTIRALPDGGVAAGTGNVGEVYVSKSEPMGLYESPVHDATRVSRWGTMRVDAIPDRITGETGIQIETRSGNTSEPGDAWSAWVPLTLSAASGLEGKVTSPPARFIQYRLKLTGSPSDTASSSGEDASPAVQEVSVSYLPRNQAPRLSFLSPAGGEHWSKTQMIRWRAEDADNDALSYDVFYSSDGVNWKPLGPGMKIAKTDDGTNADLEEARDKLATQQNVPDSVKQIIMESIQQRHNGTGGIGSLRRPSRSWDTTGIPDGTCYLKVVASDRIGNPIDPQSNEIVSQPFLVCNTPPALTVGQSIVLTDKSAALQGEVSQAMIDVTAVQYRVDSGDWIAVAAKDGLFDSPHEAFSLLTAPLSTGKHTIEIEAFNSAGNKTTQTVNVTIP